MSPPQGFKFQKPGWVWRLLVHWNWDILGWKLYIGDAIENIINAVYDLLNANWLRGDEAETDRERLRIRLGWTEEELNTFLHATWPVAQKMLIDSDVKLNSELIVMALNLKLAYTKIDLFAVDMMLIKAAFGLELALVNGRIVDLGATTEAEIAMAEERMEVRVEEMRKELEKHRSWLDSIKGFISDPLEWLLSLFTDWFLGPE